MLGYYGAQQCSKAIHNVRRDLIVKDGRKVEESELGVKATAMVKQCKLASWEAAVERKLTWKDLWPMDQGKLSYRPATTTIKYVVPR